MPYPDIFATIEKELDLFSCLYEMLEEQQQNIINRNGQRMEEAARDITELLQEAGGYRMTRSDALNKAGFENTPEDMTDFCQQYGSSEHQQDWQELVELVEHCKSLNLENGEALNILRRHTDKQLHRLANRQQRAGYSASGQSVVRSEPTLKAQA